jgi:hypothetical protein
MHKSKIPAIRWPVVFFFLYLGIQIALPVYRLFQPKPTRFGWQMFTAASVPSHVWIVSGDQLEKISAQTYIGYFRADLEWERYALPHLCRVRSQATAIRYSMPLDSAVQEYRC